MRLHSARSALFGGTNIATIGHGQGLRRLISVFGWRNPWPQPSKRYACWRSRIESLAHNRWWQYWTTKKSRSSWTKSRCRNSSLSILNSSKVVLHIIQNPILRGDQPNKPVPLLTGTTIFAHARPLYSTQTVLSNECE